MKYLPFALSLGPDLQQAIRSAAGDPRRRCVCGYCGGRMPVGPDHVGRKLRCPHCWHWQRVTAEQEKPWRLSASAAVALRRTRTWLRG